MSHRALQSALTFALTVLTGFTNLAFAQTAASTTAPIHSGLKTTKPKVAAPKTTPVIVLPDAHSGQPYQAVLAVVLPIPYGRAQCNFESLPDWLIFDPAHFVFSGTPTETKTTAYKLTLTVMNQDDPTAAPKVLVMTLPIFVGPQVVYQDPKLKPKAITPVVPRAGGVVLQPGGVSTLVQSVSPAASALVTVNPALASDSSHEVDANIYRQPGLVSSPVSDRSNLNSGGPMLQPAFAGQTPGTASAPSMYDQMQVQLTSSVIEGATSIIGRVDRIPPGTTPPLVEVWIRHNDSAPFQVQLKSTDPKNNTPSPELALDPKGGAFTANLPAPLAAGQVVTVLLAPIAGSGIIFCPLTAANPADCQNRKTKEVALDDSIPAPIIFTDTQLLAHASTITGHVDRTKLPPLPIAATSANPTTGAPATPGNLPLIGARIIDPVSGTSTVQPVQVKIDGTYSITLSNPLTVGQKVTLFAEPPDQHHFGSPPDTPEAELAGAMINPAEPAPTLMHVYPATPLSKPILTTTLAGNVTSLAGTASPSQQTGSTFNIAVRVVEPEAMAVAEKQPSCLSFDDLEDPSDHFATLSNSSSTAIAVPTTSTGNFNLTLEQPLLEGERIQLVQVLPAGYTVPEGQEANCRSQLYRVSTKDDWGRVHADFTVGILMSNGNQISSTDSGDFTQAHQFLALTVEKAWKLPGCYLRNLSEDSDFTPGGNNCYDHRLTENASPQGHRDWPFGVDSYFEARLTAIPVTSIGSKQSTSATTATASALAHSFPDFNSSPRTFAEDTSGTSVLSSNQLSTAQTARLGVGVYLPFLVTRWDYHQQPNALFIAPLAKIGFDTVTGASTITVTPNTPGSTIKNGNATITAEQLYNFRAYGARIGHFRMTRSERRAPEINSYIDITFGPYGNLESLLCNRTIQETHVNMDKSKTVTPLPGYPATTDYTGSTCKNDYPMIYSGKVPSTVTPVPPGDTLAYVPYEVRKRLYRLDFEGLLKIPNTPLYVGFNANIGQRTLGASRLDHGYAAPDDLRFLFGTKFDISTLLNKLGVTTF